MFLSHSKQKKGQEKAKNAEGYLTLENIHSL